MSATYAVRAAHRPAGLAETKLAERLGLAVLDATYERRFRRHVWFVAAVALVGLLGAVTSFWMLRVPVLSPQAIEFWLLCLVLGVGLLAIATVVFAGSLTTHMAMVRIAGLRRDTEASESLAEQEALMARLEALKELMLDCAKMPGIDRDSGKLGKPDKPDTRNELLVSLESIELIVKASDPNESEEDLSSIRTRVAMDWRRLGADQAKLAILEERCHLRWTHSGSAAH